MRSSLFGVMGGLLENEDQRMKKLFVAACCALLAGCAAGGLSQSSGSDPMESDGQTYVPVEPGTFAPLPAEAQTTSTCTMKGQNVICR